MFAFSVEKHVYNKYDFMDQVNLSQNGQLDLTGSCKTLGITSFRCSDADHMGSCSWVNIGSGNGLSPVRRQAITWTNTDLLFVGHIGTNISEIWIKKQIFSFNKMHLKTSSIKCPTFCPGPWFNIKMSSYQYRKSHCGDKMIQYKDVILPV